MKERKCDYIESVKSMKSGILASISCLIPKGVTFKLSDPHYLVYLDDGDLKKSCVETCYFVMHSEDGVLSFACGNDESGEENDLFWSRSDSLLKYDIESLYYLLVEIEKEVSTERSNLVKCIGEYIAKFGNQDGDTFSLYGYCSPSIEACLNGNFCVALSGNDKVHVKTLTIEQLRKIKEDLEEEFGKLGCDSEEEERKKLIEDIAEFVECSEKYIPFKNTGKKIRIGNHYHYLSIVHCFSSDNGFIVTYVDSNGVVNSISDKELSVEGLRDVLSAITGENRLFRLHAWFPSDGCYVNKYIKAQNLGDAIDEVLASLSEEFGDLDNIDIDAEEI